MTELLEKAFAVAARLPEEEQDMLARTLLEDFAAEGKWDETLANSQDKLAVLADEALTEFESPFSPEKRCRQFGSARGLIQTMDDF